MSEITKITNYDDNLELLIQQYKDKINFVGILQALNSQANDLEEALFEIRDNFWIDSAEGNQLDIIGEIQGELRQGRNDIDYRAAIRARIVVNNGSGEFETIITALTQLLGATIVQLQNLGDAFLFIWTDLTIDLTVFNTILRFIPAGVGLLITSGSSNPFVFFGDPAGNGFTKIEELELTFSDGTSVTFSDTNNVGMLTGNSDTNFGGELQGSFNTETT